MKKLIGIMMTATLLSACADTPKTTDNFDYTVEQFADLEILRYRVPGFENLSLQQKKLVYYLTEAALQGRDILFDQNGKWNLAIRRTLEAIYTEYEGDRDNAEFKALEKYLKQVWFANGIHHHYSTDKFTPEFSQAYFESAVRSLPAAALPLKEEGNVDELLGDICPVIFNPDTLCKRVNQEAGTDLIATSACNYYDGVTQAEAEAFYDAMKVPGDTMPISYGLNSRLVKRDGRLIEQVYRLGGRYSEAIEKIIYWLDKAAEVAENDHQREVISTLSDYYRSGDLKTFDQYAVEWVTDHSQVDFVNGFTEVYGDPIGLKGSWESIVNFKDIEASHRTEIISANAQWFENNSPIDTAFKKEEVKGVSAKVITAAILAGDCYPSTPIGINLPNADWIRHIHGSKSVTIENITSAYDKAAQGNGFGEEFIWSDKERKLINEYGFLVDNLHTDLHECLGHGSGKLLPGTSPDALRSYSSALEETRADLFALYYLADDKMVELGLLPNKEAYKAEYYRYMMNGLMTQLMRIVPGKDIEESHMRNRQLIARWILEKGADDKVLEIKTRDGKRYVVVNDYDKMRTLIGELLAEVQRIKSTGDYEAGKALVENYGVKVDRDLHAEVLERYGKLNIKPYKGFVNPVYTAVTDANGEITDVTVAYDEGYAEQMLRYSTDYSHLPTYND
ncbi:MAG: dihydrofolate reductase [Coprobacter sp.]|nr:dihydrofolate reductase [Coprobacter sp.]